MTSKDIRELQKIGLELTTVAYLRATQPKSYLTAALSDQVGQKQVIIGSGIVSYDSRSKMGKAFSISKWKNSVIGGRAGLRMTEGHHWGIIR